MKTPTPRRSFLLPPGMTPRRWVEYLAAILAGNALYFLVLFPALPEPWRHERFALDRGLALAFAFCVTIYGVIRLAVRNARRSIGKQRGDPADQSQSHTASPNRTQ